MGLPGDPDTEAIGRLLLLTAKTAREVLDARLQRMGWSHPTWLVLHALVDHGGEGWPQRSLAEHLCIEGPTLTRHLDRLEADGLIERRSDPEDRRVARVYSTAEGQTVLKSLSTIMVRSEADLVAGLSKRDVDALRSALEHVRTNVERAADEEAVPVVRHEHPSRRTERGETANVR
ncbi:MAG TPA: MarR family transcriptional regulator [Actinomycetota bacterium]|nr:MarR family transcriptional regulator [Actinomycetota bacterium]